MIDSSSQNMSNSGQKRKNKNNNRSMGRGKLNSQSSNTSTDRVYGNPRLVHALLSLVGSRCNTQVRNGGVYSGIFHTFSPNMDLAIGAAHIQDSQSGGDAQSILGVNQSDIPNKDEILDEVIFKSNDVVCAQFHDVDLQLAHVSVKSNGDAGPESRPNSTEMKALEPWVGGGDSSNDTAIGGLEDPINVDTGSTNGWGAEEMFRTNREQYGVKTSYNPDLPEYTTPLDNDNSENFAQRKARAEKLANEIENSTSYNKHINMELDENTTEEEKFSSVVREAPPPGREVMRNERNMSGRNRGRGRDQGRDSRDLRGPRPGHHYTNYSNQGGMQRGSGPPSSFGPGGGRSNTPSNAADSQISLPNQNKPFRPSGSTQSNIPPRFNRHSGGGSYPRDEERAGGRYNDGPPHHNYMNQPKGQRQVGGSQRGNFQRNHPSPTQDYNSGEPPVLSSGQSTPQQSLSRNSSSSSMTQQAPSPQWSNKMSSNDERPRPPSGGNNPPLTRNYSSGSNKESSYSSVVQNTKAGQNVPSGPPGGYSETRLRQPHAYRHGAAPTATGGTKMFYSPRGHSPPTGNPSGANAVISHVGQPQRPMIMHPQSGPTRYMGSSISSAVVNPQIARNQKSTSIEDNKAVIKKTPEPASHPSPASSNIGSSTKKDSSDDTVKGLKDFSKNFKLAESSSVNEPKQGAAPIQKKPSVDLSGPTKKSAAGKLTQQSSPGSTGAQQTPSTTSKAVDNQAPLQSQQQATQPPPKQIYSQQKPAPLQTALQSIPPVHHPIVQNQGGEMEQMISPPLILLPSTQAFNVPMLPLAIPPQPGYVIPQEQSIPQSTSISPPQPSINVPSPRTATTANDVLTVSAATGPFVSPQHLVQPLSEVPTGTFKQASDTSMQSGSETATKSAAESTTEAGAPPDAGNHQQQTQQQQQSFQMNPEAKEFTPRSFAPVRDQKPASVATSRSPTPVTVHQTLQQAYFTTTGQPIANPSAAMQMQYQILPNKTSMTKQVPGQALMSPSPSEGQVVGMSPHIAQHIHPPQPTFIQGQPYTPPSGPFLIAQHGGHQPMAAGQHGVMAPPPHYQGVESMVYTPTGHFVPRPMQPGYPAEAQIYGYPQASPQPVQIQQTQQTQQSQQGQQQQSQQGQPGSQQAQQQQQQQVAQANYMQQARPHSAHTPNQAHVPSASPATNIQPQAGGMTQVTPQSQMHPPPQNVAIQHQSYYQSPQQIIAHPAPITSMQGRMVPSSPHVSYPPHLMMLPSGPPNGQPITHSATTPGQQGYIQPTVVSTAGHVQQQYMQSRQYQQHQSQTVIPAYPAPN
ncbi:uncharacterized protein LOC143470182 isoform X2 [Clavelina lepadiformis]|uniref:uncharacterized protein LOC143470182 isoform X2 n=1 Tax=Clavelina lepadiformis TaxID=159417 RepID=UPI004042398E